MSVTLYDESKFYRIIASLLDWNNYGLHLSGGYEGSGQLAHVFGYPAGWKNWQGLDRHIFNFVNDLYRANQATWNRQYPKDTVGIASLKANMVPDKGYDNVFDLYKSLRGLHYNILDNAGRRSNVNKSNDILEAIIDDLGYAIINSMPEFQQSREW